MSAKEPVVLWISRVGGEPFTAPNLYDPTARMKFHAYPPAYVPALEAEVAALRAERDEAAKAERERIARKFDDKATTCRAMLKVETNIGRLAEYARAVAEWEFCAAMAREEAK